MSAKLIHNRGEFPAGPMDAANGVRTTPYTRRRRTPLNGGPAWKSKLESTILAKILIGYQQLVRELGGDPVKMLTLSGFDPAVLQQPDSTINFQDFALLLENSAATLNCPDFGMRLASIQNGLSLMSHTRTLMENLPTFGHVLNYSTHYMHLYCPAIQIYLNNATEYGQPFVQLEVIANDIPYRRQVTEHMLALLHSGSAIVTGGVVRPKEIWFSHQKLAAPIAYAKVFRATVRFSQPFNAAFYTDEDIRSTIVMNSPELLERELLELPKKFPNRSQFYRDVKGVVSRMVHEADCNRDLAASALRIHPRTLHRRLSAEGLTFEALRDEVRRDLAAHYLAQSDITLVDVAGRLGYSELSVLSRSCRRWFGAAPRELRKLLVARDPSLRDL